MSKTWNEEEEPQNMSGKKKEWDKKDGIIHKKTERGYEGDSEETGMKLDVLSNEKEIRYAHPKIFE